MEFLIDPSIWIGLVTLIVLDIVLGIDNLVFIIFLSDKLPPKNRDKARFIGLFLALIMRLMLLSVISWIFTLTQPLFFTSYFSFSGRNLLMLFGGIFLIFKATIELHNRLENRQPKSRSRKEYDSFCVVVLQIVILDLIFSLDSAITAVGMVNHLPIMMVAAVITMIVMLFASKLLTQYVNQHQTIFILCLSFLLMIGFSLVLEGFGFHIPKGYLYAAIGFSILTELFNGIANRNFIKQQSGKSLRDRAADAILRLMSGYYQISNQETIKEHKIIPISKESFVEEERNMINGVLSLASRSLRGIMTPRKQISWIDVNENVLEIRKQLLISPYSLFPVCRGNLDKIIGVAHVKEILIAIESRKNIEELASASPALLVKETLNLINLPGIFRKENGNFIIVENNSSIIQGLITPLDFLEAIIGGFSCVDKTTNFFKKSKK